MVYILDEERINIVFRIKYIEGNHVECMIAHNMWLLHQLSLGYNNAIAYIRKVTL
jgi:hypothetical protein